ICGAFARSKQTAAQKKTPQRSVSFFVSYTQSISSGPSSASSFLRKFFIFLQLLPLLRRELRRNLNLYRHILISVYLTVFHRNNALSPQADLPARLRPGRNLADHIAVQRREADLAAEHRRRKRNIGRRVDVH